jgi:hypothetical protein
MPLKAPQKKTSTRLYNDSQGARVTRPQGYIHAANGTCFCLLVWCLPCYQSLLLAGISGMISLLLVTALLAFLVARAPEICHIVAAFFKAFPLSWVSPFFDRCGRWVFAPLHAATGEPSLAPCFQRPPPIFS